MTEQEEFLSTLVWDGSSPSFEIPSDSGSEPVLEVCTKCIEEQPLDYFYKDIRKSDGVKCGSKS